jgi:hypothetical protein
MTDTLTIVAKKTRQLKDGLDKALENRDQRVVVQHRRAKRMHRAIKGIKELSPANLARLGGVVAAGNLLKIGRRQFCQRT